MKHTVELEVSSVSALTVAFEPVIAKRGNAVHNLSELAPPVPHPVAGNSTQAMVDFGAEGAAEAVAAMQAIYWAVVQAPKPGAQRWVSLQAVGLRQVAGLAPRLGQDAE